MPDTRFVIALLTKGDNDFNREEKREYLRGKTDPYDTDDLMYQKIYKYEVDGWKIAFGPGGSPFMVNYGDDGLTTSLYVGGPLETRVLFWGFMIIAYIVALIVFLRNERTKERG